jgi:hypothetical protein
VQNGPSFAVIGHPRAWTQANMPHSRRRPGLAAVLIIIGFALLQDDVEQLQFAAPATRTPKQQVSSKLGGLTQQSQQRFARGRPDARPQGNVPLRSLASTVAPIGQIGVAAFLFASIRNRLRNAGGEKWDARRKWTAGNVINHGIYAALFIIRTFFYTDVGGNDRPFYYESHFLGWLCGPSWFLPKILGWTNGQYSQPVVLKWMAKINGADSGAYPAWIAPYAGSPDFMFYYQIAEGTFHFMIVLGGLRSLTKVFGKQWPPKEGDNDLKLFRYGLWLEIIFMDITYVTGFSCLPFLQVPGHFGLTFIMMLIHHLNVVPDIACAWYEWKASRPSKFTLMPKGVKGT